MNFAAPRLAFLLDTPNVWRGRALAGTPARVLALAEHAHRAAANVTLVLCDRGADYGAWNLRKQHKPMRRRSASRFVRLTR